MVHTAVMATAMRELEELRLDEDEVDRDNESWIIDTTKRCTTAG